MEQSSRAYLPFAVSALLMWVLLCLIFPYYRYYIDPDGTSYLTIAQRYADGDIDTAINGLWSPWACWLTALLIKAGVQAIPASVVVNAFAATGFLLISHSFFIRFGISAKIRWAYCLSLVVFLCYAIFWQSFDDLWGCFFMLVVLRIMIYDGFTKKPALWVVIGLVGALAFFAKAYSLPYFVLAVSVSVFFLVGRSKLQWFKIMMVATTVLLLGCFPWMYALHSKYGIWTTSTAGSLNMSWYLVGHPEWKDGIDILVPPIYPSSVFYWEDPWYVNGHISHFWDSTQLMIRQGLKLGYNFLMLVWCMVELSAVLPLIAIVILWHTIRRFRQLPVDVLALYLFFILLPAGYIMVHLEGRYLWLMLPIAMVVAYREMPSIKMPAVRKFALPIFIISLLVFPLYGLGIMFNKGRAEYEFAQWLNANGIKGKSFVSNLHPRFLSKAMYHSGNNFYVINKQRPEANEDKGVNTGRLRKDIAKYRVDYYLHSPNVNGNELNPGFNDIFLGDLTDGVDTTLLKKVLHDSSTGFTLYQYQWDPQLGTL